MRRARLFTTQGFNAEADVAPGTHASPRRPSVVPAAEFGELAGHHTSHFRQAKTPGCVISLLDPSR